MLPLKRSKINRFDIIVIAVLLVMALITVLILWRGDQVGLQVVTVSPAQAATDVSTRSQIKVTFDQAILAPETDQPLLTVSPSVSGTVRWDDKALSFTPALPLTSNTLYTITVTGDVTSQRGRPLKEAVSWQFQTGQPRLLYIAKDTAGNDQIFVIDPDGGEVVQLTQEIYGVFDYALAPDASTVAYSALREDGSSDLWATTPDGQTRYPLLTCPDAVCNGVAWQPNSDRLIYERRNMLVPGAAPGPPRLWWLNLANSETVAVFDDNQIIGYGATWAANGQWLSYIAPSSQGVQLFHVDDGRNFVIPSRLGGLAIWDPVGESLLVADIQPSAEGFAVHLLKASPVSGELVDISGDNQLVEDTSPTWSPDGQWIALTRKAAGASMGKQVWLMRSDGSEAHSLTDNTEIHHGLPAWSPDGRYLAFQQFPLRAIDAKPSIWLFDFETETMQQLVADGNRPAWIP